MEFVYTVDRTDLFNLRYPQGFHALSDDGPEDVSSLRKRAITEGFFIQREEAEETSGLKQIIPYLLIQRGDHLLEVERLEEQSEERLHSMFSIGLGGHLNPEDTGHDDLSLFDAGIRRELHEELQFESEYDAEFVGIVNDDSNNVGSVHFGLVYRVDFPGSKVDIRETENMKGAFRTTDELVRRCNDMPEQFESWSRLIIDDISHAMSV